jgi:hypothetical protein
MKVANAAINKFHLTSSKLFILHNNHSSMFAKKDLGELNEKAIAWKMPEGCVAPFLMKSSSKQLHTRCRDVLVLRASPSSLSRREQILRLILLNKPVSSAIVGLPRVGKTTELNYYTIELFHELSRHETRLKVLLLRIGESIYDCSYDTTSKSIKVEEYPCEDLRALNTHCKRFYREFNFGEVVLILDLQEDEIDPKINLPFITALSSREANSVLKTECKSQVVPFFLYDLPSNLELEAIVRAYHANVEDNVVLEEHPNASIEEVLDIVRRRCDIIGNYFMFAIDTDFDFLFRQSKISSNDVIQALTSIQKCSVFNVPQEAKFFFCPVLRPGVIDPTIGGKYSISAKEYLGENYDVQNDIYVNQIFMWDFVSKYARKIFFEGIYDENEKLYRNLHYLKGIKIALLI